MKDEGGCPLLREVRRVTCLARSVIAARATSESECWMNRRDVKYGCGTGRPSGWGLAVGEEQRAAGMVPDQAGQQLGGAGLPVSPFYRPALLALPQ